MMTDDKLSKESKIFNSEDWVILYLVSCALNDHVPDERHYLKADPELVYRKAEFHKVVSMVAHALEKNGYRGISAEAVGRFRNAMYKAVRKNILLDEERRVILKYMEDEGIKYLPLKGIIIQNMYPEPGMRQMSDNDILYDEACRDKIRKFMGSRGFHVKGPGIAPEELYYKEPVYNFEMHSALFSDQPAYRRYFEYYKDPWARAVRDDEGYGYHFSDEDFYIYMTVHAAKHYYRNGTGIRTLTDFFVVNRKLTGMDRVYIKKELESLGLVDFEKMMRGLADRLFAADKVALVDAAEVLPGGHAEVVPVDTAEVESGGPDADSSPAPADLSADERDMLCRILGSGAYGTTENKVVNLMKERGIDGEITEKKRIKYYLKRLFPDQETLIPYYPLARYKILVPAINAFRIVRGITVRRRKVSRELEIARGQKYIK